MYSKALLTALLATSAIANKIRIDVGNGGLIFTPDRVEAVPGDILSFVFFAKNHSVSQSSFAAPCTPLANGFNSGFIPIANDSLARNDATATTFEIQVNDTKPIWVYCGQARHCQSQMNLVVNQPSGKNTLEAYRIAAANVSMASIGPVAPLGGILRSGAASSLSTSAAPSSTVLTTYTDAYSTYTTSSSGASAPTTVTLIQTVTALSGITSASVAPGSSTTSAGTTASTGAAATNGLASGWVIVGAAAGIGGLLI